MPRFSLPLRSCAVIVSLLVLPACATKTITNPESLPALHQRQDFEAEYRGRATDIIIPGSAPPRAFNYEELEGVQDVALGDVLQPDGTPACWTAFGFKFHPVTNAQQLGDHTAPPGQPRPFEGSAGNPGQRRDWEAVIQGRYHCSPTVAAMVLTYWAREKGKPNLLQGLTNDAAGQVGLIKRLAEVVDTNDQNLSKNQGNHLGQIGTFGRDQISGIREYATANGGYNLVVTPVDFDFDAYKREIDASRPVIIHFGNPGRKVGHVVVGYGYRRDDVLYKDPATGAIGEKPAAQISRIRTLQEGLDRLYGAVPLPVEPAVASQLWIGAFMVLVSEAVSP